MRIPFVRSFAWVPVALLAVAASFAAERSAPGVELVYELDRLPESPPDTLEELRDRTLAILRERLANGVLVEPEGRFGLRARIPWYVFPESDTLVSDLPADATTLELAGGGETLPPHGGLVGVNGELLRYARLEGGRLAELERGVGGTTPIAHTAGTAIYAIDVERYRERLESVGRLEFRIEMDTADFERLGTSEEREREALDRWRAGHSRAEDLDGFYKLARVDGGPADGVSWYAAKDDVPWIERLHLPLKLDERPAWRFDASDLASVWPGQDQLGYPAVNFRMRSAREQAFGDFTGAYVNRTLAILIDDRIVTLANIKSRLPGGGIIQGGETGYTDREVERIVALLSGGALPAQPVLVSMKTYGPE